MGETVLYDLDRARHVATITYNRPDALNAVNGELRRDLNDAFARRGATVEAIRFGETMRRVASATDDAAEGGRAFREGREPRWTGR